MEKDWHVCLVSEQPLANLLPALAKPRPEGVVLCVTQPMKDRAAALRGVLHAKGILVEEFPLGAAPNDIRALRNSFGSLIEGSRQPGTTRRLCLNATGGTKLMAIVAVQAFRERGLPVFYLDEERLAWLDVEGQISARSLFTEELGVRDVLEAHGWTVEDTDPSPSDTKWRNGAHKLVDYARASPQNFLASMKAVKQMLNPQNPHPRGSPSSRPKVTAEVKSILVEAGLITRKPKPSDAHGLCTAGNPKSNATNYITGGWLEDYVEDCVRALHPDDLASRVRIRRAVCTEQADPAQLSWDAELDVVIQHRGRLYIIECKTVKKGNGRSDIQAIVDHVRACRSYGGRTTRVALLMLEPLSNVWEERLRRDGINLWGLPELGRLDEVLRQWIERKPPA